MSDSGRLRYTLHPDAEIHDDDPNAPEPAMPAAAANDTIAEYGSDEAEERSDREERDQGDNKTDDEDDTSWYVQMMEDQEDKRHNPDWYIRAMHDDRHFGVDPDWVFSRADERDVERNKHWSLRRGELRGDVRHHDDHHRRHGDDRGRD